MENILFVEMARGHFLVLAALVAVVAVTPVLGEDEAATAGPSLVKVWRRGGAHPGAFEWRLSSCSAGTDTGARRCSKTARSSMTRRP
jgi:hypothetical protein